VESLVIDAFTPHVKNLIKAVELAGGQVGGLVLTPLASARCALSKAQKDLGVALLDIGSGTTGLCVWEENKLVGVAKLPVGASNITNDIAIGLKIPVAAAEALKLGYGHALAREINAKEAIDMKKIYPEGKGSISRRFLGDIIESRLAEIFDFINNELKQMGRAGQLAGGLVIIGGAAKMPGLTELASQELKLSTQIGLPTGDEWQMETAGFSQYLEDPEFITALGLVLWGLDQGDFPAKTKLPDFKLKGLLKYFLP
jgi:cell division protein FtsA